jgi:nitroreductase
LAPSWANTQCWRFIVVRDQDVKNRLADSLAINPVKGENPAVSSVKIAPVVIVALAEKKVSGYFGGLPATELGDCWYMFDIALAVENMALAATALGLGTVIIGLTNLSKITAILEIPDGFQVAVMMPLGYPEILPKPRPRKELSEIVFKDKFGQK